MKTTQWIMGTMALALVAGPVAAEAPLLRFEMLSNYSRATLTVDPARPAAASGTVKVDMNAVKTGIDKRDADLLFLKVNNDIQIETDLVFVRQ